MKKYVSKLIILFVTVNIFLFLDYRINIDLSHAESKAKKEDQAGEKNVKNPSVKKIEVVHFHGTYDCDACRKVGKYAEQTVKTFYARELEEGKIVVKSVNSYLPENTEILLKYGAASSSLWLGIYDKNGFRKEQLAKVWYKVNNMMAFMSYLKMLIDKRLTGDFT